MDRRPGEAALRVLARHGPWLLAAALFSLFYFPGMRHLPARGLQLAYLGARLVAGLRAALHGDPRLLSLPLTEGPNNGPGVIYATAFFVALFGSTARAIVVENAAFALATLWLTFETARALYRDGAEALVAALLVAAAPVFVLMTMWGVYTGVSCVACAVACLWCALRYEETLDARLACATAALAGLAFFLRSSMAAFDAGLLAWAWACRRRLGLTLDTPQGRRRLLACGAALPFVLPVLYGFLAPDFARVYWIGHTLAGVDGRRNLWDYGPSFVDRLWQTAGLFAGTRDFVGYVDGPRATPWSAWLVVPAAALAARGCAARSTDARTRARLLLPWAITLAYLALSPISPDFLSPYHLFALLPVLALCFPAALPRRPGPARRAALTACGALILGCVARERSVFAALARQQEAKDALLTTLLPRLEAARGRRVVLFNVAWAGAVAYLTDGRLVPDALDDDGRVRALDELRASARPEEFLYVVPDAESNGPWLRFREMAAAAGRPLRGVDAIPGRDGRTGLLLAVPRPR